MACKYAAGAGASDATCDAGSVLILREGGGGVGWEAEAEAEGNEKRNKRRRGVDDSSGSVASRKWIGEIYVRQSIDPHKAAVSSRYVCAYREYV